MFSNMNVVKMLDHTQKSSRLNMRVARQSAGKAQPFFKKLLGTLRDYTLDPVKYGNDIVHAAW